LRFGIDDTFQAAIKPLAEISSSASVEELKMCHYFVIPDLNQDSFILEYYETAEFLNRNKCETALASLEKIINMCPDQFNTVKCALGRTLAAKPHSADVERSISKLNEIPNRIQSSLIFLYFL